MHVIVQLAITVFFAVGFASAQTPHHDGPCLCTFVIKDADEGLVLPVMIGNSRYPFVIDTGSTISCVDVQLRRHLGRRIDEVVGRTLPGERHLEIFELPRSPRAGPIELPSRVVCCDLKGFREASGIECYGMLGMDVLARHVFEIDFGRAALTFYKSLPAAHGRPAQLRLSKMGAPLVEVNFGDVASDWALIDTGSLGFPSIDVSHDVFERLSDSGGINRLQRRPLTIASLGGEGPTESGVLSVFGIAGDKHRNLEVTRSDLPRIGLGFFSRYVVTFDFPRQMMYLRPRPGIAIEELHDLGGLCLCQRNGVFVRSAEEHGAAAAAGLAPGDLIIAVNGKRGLRVAQVRRMLTSPGRVEIEFRRGAIHRRALLSLSVKQEIGPPVHNRGNGTGTRVALREPTSSRSTEKETALIPKQRDEADLNELAKFNVAGMGGVAIVPITLGKKQFPFLIHTGSSLTAYDSRLRGYLGKRVGESPVAMLPGEVQVDRFEAPLAQLGVISVPPADRGVSCSDLQMWRDLIGTDVYGILGMDFLSRHIVRVDFDTNEITFYRHLPSDPGVRAGISLKHGLPFATGELAEIPFQFLVNTGFFQLHSLQVPERVFDLLIEGGQITSLADDKPAPSSASMNEFGRLTSFAFHGGHHRDLIVSQSALPIIGVGFLSRYVVTFDFPDRAMYLKKGRRFADPDLYDLSGMTVVKRDRIIVMHVEKGSAAENAGVASGDVITRVNGIDAAHLELQQFRRILATPGRIEVDILRGASEASLTLSLDV